MSDTREIGVLYTEHARLAARTPVSSLWSYETCARGRDRRSVAIDGEGNHEYWLDRCDPLLNTILPGTGVSIILNLGDRWAAGRSLSSSEVLPPACIVGPVTQARILRVGRFVRAIGAGFSPTLAPVVAGVPASELVDRIVPLDDLWAADDVERMFARISSLEIRQGVLAVKRELIARICRAKGHDRGSQAESRLIEVHDGRASVDDMARACHVSRQQFTRRFTAAAGLPPKLFARITRFQTLVHALLSTDVAQWASVAPAVGFYDQAHMINEFRAFAGSPPTLFFQPHGIDPANVRRRGRPAEWLLVAAHEDRRSLTPRRNF